MRLIHEELELNLLECVDANEINHNLWGPIMTPVCEVWQMKDRRYIVGGIGYATDQDGGEHEIDFEVVLTPDDYERFVASQA